MYYLIIIVNWIGCVFNCLFVYNIFECLNKCIKCIYMYYMYIYLFIFISYFFKVKFFDY